jgi:predicted nucleic acid-binding protein
LTAVTIAELQAGARSPQQAALIEQLAALFARQDRHLTPAATEWAAAGRLIARAIARRGFMEPRDHYPDVLIAQIAERIGAAVITDNAADFREWIRLGRLDSTVTSAAP